MANPFQITNPNESFRQGALELQEAQAEEWLSKVRGQPVDLPSTGGLGFGKRLVNALAQSKLPGLEVFQPAESAARIDYQTLTPEERQQFSSMPKLQQVFLMSKNPGGIATLAADEDMWNMLTAEEPTIFQEAMSFYGSDAGKNLDPAGKAIFQGLLIDQMAASGYAGMTPDLAVRAKTLLDSQLLSAGEERDLLAATASPSLSVTPVIEQLEQKLQMRVEKERQDTATSRASEVSQYASAESARENVRVSKRGDLYRLVDPQDTSRGVEVYESDPRYRELQAQGWRVAGKVGALGAAASDLGGVGLPFTTAARTEAQKLFGSGTQRNYQIKSLGHSVINHPGLVGPIDKFIQDNPLTAAIPGGRILTQAITGLEPEALAKFKADQELLATGIATEVIGEPRITDPERQRVDAIFASKYQDTPEAVVQRMRAAYELNLMAQERRSFEANGGVGFLHDLSTEQGQDAFLDEVVMRYDYDGKKFEGGLLDEESAMRLMDDLRASQEQMKKVYGRGQP